MDGTVLRATHTGKLRIGNIELECHVLENKQRVFTALDFISIFNLGAGNIEPKHNTTILRRFFDRIKLNSILENEKIIPQLSPIRFHAEGGRGLARSGYVAELLPEICNAVLRMQTENWLPIEMREAARQSRKLLNTFAKIGVIALVDEATGYQEIRDKNELQNILDKYLRKEWAVWAKRFPDDFYKELFRLRGWIWRGMKVNRPSVVGTYTKDIVYKRLAPGILEELEQLNPISEDGKRKVRHHQWLTDDIGHPALNVHIIGTLALMKASVDWNQFQRSLTRAFPKIGEQKLLELEEE